MSVSLKAPGARCRLLLALFSWLAWSRLGACLQKRADEHDGGGEDILPSLLTQEHRRGKDASLLFEERVSMGFHSRDLNFMGFVRLLSDSMQYVGKQPFGPDGVLALAEPVPRFFGANSEQWFFLVASCLCLYLIDLFLFRKVTDTIVGQAAVCVAWIAAGLLFNIAVWSSFGYDGAFQWCIGYLMEWQMSMDNVLAFYLILEAYRTPACQLHKALTVGAGFGVLARLVLFILASRWLHLFAWLRWPFGALLLGIGVQTAWCAGRASETMTEVIAIQIFRNMIGCKRFVERYDPDGHRLITYGISGEIQVTLLCVVAFCIELSDAVLSWDSVVAKAARVPNQYLAFSSSALALFGLRAFARLVWLLARSYELLAYGIACILTLLGFMLMSSVQLRVTGTMVLLLAIFAISLASSSASKALRSKLGFGIQEPEG